MSFKERLDGRADLWFRGCEPEKHPPADGSELADFMAGAKAALELLAEEIDRKLDIWDDDAEAKIVHDWLRARAREIGEAS